MYDGHLWCSSWFQCVLGNKWRPELSKPDCWKVWNNPKQRLWIRKYLILFVYSSVSPYSQLLSFWNSHICGWFCLMMKDLRARHRRHPLLFISPTSPVQRRERGVVAPTPSAVPRPGRSICFFAMVIVFIAAINLGCVVGPGTLPSNTWENSLPCQHSSPLLGWLGRSESDNRLQFEWPCLCFSSSWLVVCWHFSFHQWRYLSPCCNSLNCFDISISPFGTLCYSYYIIVSKVFKNTHFIKLNNVDDTMDVTHWNGMWFNIHSLLQVCVFLLLDSQYVTFKNILHCRTMSVPALSAESFPGRTSIILPSCPAKKTYPSNYRVNG